jgi:hypothetical protein
MSPHPRIRKTIEWGGAAVTVLLLVVWVASGWFMYVWVTPRCLCVFLGRGAVGYGRVARLAPGDYADTLPADIERANRRWQHFQMLGRPSVFNNYTGPEVVCPVWIPAAAMASITLLAWRLDALARRRARTTHCPKCGYDRAGIAAEAKCPECGSAPA